jgi:hypothetical protein
MEHHHRHSRRGGPRAELLRKTFNQ